MASINYSASYDIVVIGGTSSGVGAAIAAAREGKKVALVEWSTTLGGMISNGISYTDIGIAPQQSIAGFPDKTWIAPLDLVNGLFNEFREKVSTFYGDDPKADSGLRYEPKVANQMIVELVEAESNIDYDLQMNFLSVTMTDDKINSVTVTGSDSIPKTISLNANGYVIDATDCGDVLAAANCDFRLGRESKEETGEAFAGVIYWNEYSANNQGFYQFLTEEPYVTTHAGDNQIQAYAYMMTIKDYGGKAPNVIETPPPGYNKEDYVDGLSSINDTWTIQAGYMPNNKYEVNVHPKGSDMQVINYDYATGDRAAINETYKNHALGYLYYIQNELGQNNYGLAEDEYTDNDNFPTRLYVRESRRVVGYSTFTEFDGTPFTITQGTDGKLTGEYISGVPEGRPPVNFDGVTILSYAMDSHATTPYPGYRANDPSVKTKGQGEFYISPLVGPGNVPFGCLVPKTGATNLMVSQAVSATHVGFGGLRMEPTRMCMGQAAGVAASMAMSANSNNPNLFESNDQVNQDFIYNLQHKLVSSLHGLTLYYYGDLSGFEWAEEAIQMLSLWEIVQGFTNYQYLPAQQLTRAEFLTMIMKAISRFSDQIPQLPNSKTYTGFSDVSESDWYFETVKEAYEKGIINGYPDGTFKPNNTLIRAEAAAILLRAFGIELESFDDLPFIDVKSTQWYYNTVGTINNEGIMTGSTNSDDEQVFLPAQNINRAEGAQIVYRAIQKFVFSS